MHFVFPGIALALAFTVAPALADMQQFVCHMNHNHCDAEIGCGPSETSHTTVLRFDAESGKYDLDDGLHHSFSGTAGNEGEYWIFQSNVPDPDGSGNGRRTTVYHFQPNKRTLQEYVDYETYATFQLGYGGYCQ